MSRISKYKKIILRDRVRQSKETIRSQLIALYVHSGDLRLLAGNRRAGAVGESGEPPRGARREPGGRCTQHRAELQHCH